ncbi:PRMT5-domain-containing protein [Panus rudis PR-1116 ss-1]|nr:PRMT5-domain-containing protein [Panus rudis PR-1116 ss-1]
MSRSTFILHLPLPELASYTTPPTPSSSTPFPPTPLSPSPSPSHSHSHSTSTQSQSQSQVETPVLRATSEARAKGYEGIAVPLTNERWRTRWAEMCLLPPGDLPDRQSAERKAEAWRGRPVFAREEVNVTRLGMSLFAFFRVFMMGELNVDVETWCEDEAEGIVAFASEWLELDASDDWVRHDAEIALLQELAYASYLNIQTVILPPPRSRTHVASYARTLNAALKAVPYMQLSVRIPIYDPPRVSPSKSKTNLNGDGGEKMILGMLDQTSIASWEIWDTIRTVCGYDARVTLTLDLTPPLPTELAVLQQWVAEPTRFLYIPATTFIANAKGYPVLPKPTQNFIRDVMKIHPTIILSGTSSGRHAKGGEQVYAQYIRHLEKTSPAVKAAMTAGTVENFAQGYQDYLQAPLQPLMDNLQSFTYQTFEQDPVKYRNYEEAVYRALLEWSRPGRIVICVAGAGRGPLVQRCLNAVARLKGKGKGKERDVLVYAVEKNPNAFVTLQERLEREWGDERVKLLFGDMRTLDVPEQVDILVSELLGSFGDNELSPECLDGAMRFLKPDGISIPSSYTAHLAPLSSSKLFNETSAGKDEKSSETPYVVMFQAINILSGEGGGASGKCGPRIQECWEFEHPRRDVVLNAQGLPYTNSHNTRFAKLVFHIPHASVLHGFAGYFEAVLYGNVGLSIHPERMDKISKDMLSWFPLYFPLKEPLYLPSNCELHVCFWRLTNERQVWYEWHAEAFLPLPLGSPGSTISRTGTSRSTNIFSNPSNTSNSNSNNTSNSNSDNNKFSTPRKTSLTPTPRSLSATPSTFADAELPSSPREINLIPPPAAHPPPLLTTEPMEGIEVEGEAGGEGLGGTEVKAGELEGGGGEDGNDERDSLREDESKAGLVKIGQTSLHNPKGRSSWIGL